MIVPFPSADQALMPSGFDALIDKATHDHQAMVNDLVALLEARISYRTTAAWAQATELHLDVAVHGQPGIPSGKQFHEDAYGSNDVRVITVLRAVAENTTVFDAATETHPFIRAIEDDLLALGHLIGADYWLPPAKGKTWCRHSLQICTHPAVEIALQAALELHLDYDRLNRRALTADTANAGPVCAVARGRAEGSTRIVDALITSLPLDGEGHLTAAHLIAARLGPLSTGGTAIQPTSIRDRSAEDTSLAD